MSFWISELDSTGEIVCVVGRGLVGNAIVSALQPYCRETISGRLDWTACTSRNGWRVIEQALSNLKFSSDKEKIFVWAAGNAGPATSMRDCENELAIFESFTHWIKRSMSVGAVRLELISSVGGLYGGQQVVDNSTIVCPVGAYGWLKLSQENLAKNIGCDVGINRLTSAYDSPHVGHRIGIVTLLLKSARFSQSVHIYADPLTRRDYIFSDDIGRHIAYRVLYADVNSCAIETVASGCVADIVMLVNLVQLITSKRVRVSFTSSPIDRDDVFVAIDSISNHYLATPLDAGLAIAWARYMSAEPFSIVS